jgi:hypothetical protein
VPICWPGLGGYQPTILIEQAARNVRLRELLNVFVSQNRYLVGFKKVKEGNFLITFIFNYSLLVMSFLHYHLIMHAFLAPAIKKTQTTYYFDKQNPNMKITMEQYHRI